MFSQMGSPHLNSLVQAFAASMYKGAEVQKEQGTASEKARQFKFIVRKEQQLEEFQKPDNTSNQGRLA